MELHQLRYVRDVAHHGSFTAAAEAAHVSQSGVSAQVAKLERELGHPLFERGPRSLSLTPAGEELLPLVRAALDAVDQIPAAADGLAGLTRGRVRIGMAVGCTMAPFLDAYADFASAHPQVRMSLTEGPSDELLALVANGELDLALTGFLDDPSDELAATVLFDEPVVAVLPRDHRLARLRMANLLPDQLVDETLMCLPPGTGVRAAWDRTALHAGVDPRPAVEASSAQALEQLVRRGTGIAILSPSMVTDTDLAVRQINGGAKARFGLVARSGHLPPAPAALLASLTAVLGGVPTEPLGSTTHPPADV